MGYNDRMYEEYEYKCGCCHEWVTSYEPKSDGEFCDVCTESVNELFEEMADAKEMEAL